MIPGAKLLGQGRKVHTLGSVLLRIANMVDRSSTVAVQMITVRIISIVD
jgi:hypothetical protein